MKPKIFISYRRDDTSASAGRLYDFLINKYKKESIFKDVNSIPLGMNFQKVIESKIGESDIVLAVIGRKFANIKDTDGNKKIFNSNDFVFMELKKALELKKIVIPVLVDGANIPRQNDLPNDLHEITLLNGMKLTHDSWYRDTNKLYQEISKIWREVTKKRETFTKNKTFENTRLSKLKKIIFGVVLIAIVVVGINVFMNTKNSMHATPEKTVVSFFEAINSKNYKTAFKMTNASDWKTYQELEDSFSNQTISDIKKIKAKSYYSNIKADTIVNFTYRTKTNSLIKTYSTDVHLSRNSKGWMINKISPARTPEIDALRVSELPNSSKEAVNTFLYFLNKQLYEKAYLLFSNEKPFFSRKEFLSKKGFGCVDQITIIKIERRPIVNANNEIIYAEYATRDTCNGSSTYKHQFYVSKTNDNYWQIDKIVPN